MKQLVNTAIDIRKKCKVETLSIYTINNAVKLCDQQNGTYFVYNGDDEMGSVLPKVVQAPTIVDELLKAAEILPKFQCEGSKRPTEEVLQHLKSSFLTASDFRGKLHSLKMCSKI